MTIIRRAKPAFGQPGTEPRWSSSRKDAIGTAHSRASRVWFTVARGALTEVYYPHLDKPQLRELQLVVTDGETFVHNERGHMTSTVEAMSPHSLGLRIVNTEPQGRYKLVKELVANPSKPTVLMHTRLETSPEFEGRLSLYVVVNPHMGGTGIDDDAMVAQVASRSVLVANRDDHWVAVAATVPFARASCGYVGESDGWTDLSQNKRLTWDFDVANAGNVAMVGELDLSGVNQFTLGIGFGNHVHDATTTLLQTLAEPFAKHRDRFNRQWEEACKKHPQLEQHSNDGGKLYHLSNAMLRAHEDKGYPGAMIASLSIPWGESKGDDDMGGYHLVWPRDMVKSTTALMACGSRRTPLRALIYLAVAQREDGGFNQNFWLNGEPYWTAIQLDEVALPIMLAWRLHQADALVDFDPYPMVMRAAAFLVREGPATDQERWEENSGYSPSTLATNIAALTCAASFARLRGDESAAVFLQEYADFLEDHVEAWTVTTQGSLLADVPRHYIRIHPVEPGDLTPNEDPNVGSMTIKNRRPEGRHEYPAKEVVDAGFLELVRYGVRAGNDPLIEDSLRVVDATLKVDTPAGPAWHRYNHDGYGEGPSGEPFSTWGIGRAWPLLTGERGHYELAAGRDVKPYLHALEKFANEFGLLPEQVWDREDDGGGRFALGKPTDAAMPLCWAHGEYVKLLRSYNDGQVFDRIDAVYDRYVAGQRKHRKLEVWKFNRRVQTLRPGYTLRVQAAVPFRLRWSKDAWATKTDEDATPTSLGIHFVDLEANGTRSVDFTFFWTEAQNWEDQEFHIEVEPAPVLDPPPYPLAPE